MKKIKQLIWSILNLTFLGGLIQLRIKSALKEEGWFKSFKNKEAIDNNGAPIPWCCYSFLHFMKPRLKKHFNVFEYGCGNSTIWYASKVKSVKSVEHHQGWVDKIQSKMPQNTTIVYKKLEYGGEYSKEVSNSNMKYHIIIVDGRDRVNCLKNSLNSLEEDGVIVFDNSEIEQYQSGINEVLGLGFKRLDFNGMLPVVAHNSCTTILYKNNNCLGI